MTYQHGYNHPTPEELAHEVAEEGRIREEMAAEYERDRVTSMIAELESLGYTVTKEES
jgi:hypothetical protein